MIEHQILVVERRHGMFEFEGNVDMYAAEEYGIKAHMSGMQVFELSFCRENGKRIAVLLGKTMDVGQDRMFGLVTCDDVPAGCSGGVKVSREWWD
jgi:hypothetical protein